MITQKQHNRLYRLINEVKQAVRADETRGMQEPQDAMNISLQLKLSELKLKTFMAEITEKGQS